MEENSTSSKEVVVLISDAEGGSEVSTQDQDFGYFEQGSYSSPIHTLVDPPVAKPDSVQSRKQMPPFTSIMPLEITKLSPKSAIKSPDGPVTRRRLVRQPLYSKPKSRLVESAYPSSWKVGDGKNGETVPTLSSSVVPAAASDRVGKVKAAPVTPRTPLIGSIRGDYVEDNGDDDDEVYQLGNLEVGGKKIRKFNVVASIEWVAFLCMMAFLTVILTISKLKNSEIWSLELWKWCVLGLVMFCGRLFTEWLINFVVFAVEKNYLYKRKVLYFIYSLKKSTCVFVWLFLVFLAWVLLIDGGVRRSRRTTKILHYITRTLISALIGAALWVIKTFLVKLLASYFHVRRYFDKIQETIFQQYVLQTLSGPPLMEDADGVGSSSAASGRMCFKSTKKGKQKEDVIDVMKLQTMKREKVSAWTMGGLVKVIRNSGLSILSNALDSDDDNESVEQNIKMITDEWEAKAAAARIFKHVSKSDHNYIDEEDLLRFVSTTEVDNVLLLFEGAIEKGKIKKSTFSNWVVNVYKERKFLRHSLNDSKTAIEELHRLVAGIVVIVIIIAWLLLMEFTTTTVLLFIASQLLVLVFIFGNTLKTTFEAIIFIFVMHPFDVGDRCVIDGVQMVVEEMNILTTIFLRTDNEKVYYPNSVLAEKVISNYNRSPKMSDSVEFCIDVSTSADIIASLKARIKAYIESKPEHWRPEHSVQIKEIENVDKLRMALNITHTMNFQNYGEKNNRRSKLLLELKRIFEELGIKYHLLPQQVGIR